MWLNNFLCKRDLKKPNGSPLYTYQVSDSEFNELKIYLQSAVQHDKENYILPALFCLYCSEWYRRFYKGEWSWEPILKSLNIKLETNFRSYLVQNGLKYWNRQIIRYNNSHNSYLGSIFREGGLPYSLLIQEGSRFQELFRKILDLYYKNPQLILEQNSLLPFLNYFPEAFKEKTTLSLIIEMASNLISLVDKHDLAHLSDPIGYLEENLPDWRIKFPIPLTDKTADKFILGLFNSVVKEKKLRLKTMWKDAPATVDAQGPDHTSEYNGGDASFHKNSIAKEGGKNKSKESGYAQRAWHGSGMDFNEFTPEKALTGAGDMVHGRFTLLKTKDGPGV